MKQLSTNTKTAIIMQAMNRSFSSIAGIAASNNIGKFTLSRWIRNYKYGKIPKINGSNV